MILLANEELARFPLPDYPKKLRDMKRDIAQAQLKKVVEWLELHQGASEAITEEWPVFGGKVVLTPSRRFRLKEVDWQALKKEAGG